MTAVKLLAHTQIDPNALASLGYNVHESPLPDGRAELIETSADELAEAAGRNCYMSWNRPNPNTAMNSDYLAHIIEVGHESVLEHASATFYINASRSVLAELERHRHLSFSVVSQRYVDVSKLDHHVPPAVEDLPDDAFDKAMAILERSTNRALDDYDELVDLFVESGKPRKQAREAARAVIPNMTDSPMVVTGNHRAWRYVIKARWHEAADAEIRELAGLLLTELRKIAPNTYRDIPDEPYSY